eukprot:2487514-Amphidinium_carterae.1
MSRMAVSFILEFLSLRSAKNVLESLGGTIDFVIPLRQAGDALQFDAHHGSVLSVWLILPLPST